MITTKTPRTLGDSSIDTEYVKLDTADLQTGYRGGSTFYFEQTTPSKVWNITHNLKRHPSVTVIDSAESVVYGDVTYLNDDSIKIEFSAEFSGKAYLN